MSQQTRVPAPHWSATPLARVLGPMREFINREASSGIILLAATIIAVVIANSPLAVLYEAILHTDVGLVAGPFELKLSLLHWINDGLMAIFFFVVGLEIKREVLVGELANPRAAALPIVAAIGGVLVPAAIYLAFNANAQGAHGWGVPIATDIAFALGCLALLGSRVPFALKIFLTAVAIVDDLIAVLVIAVFYSAGIDLAALGAGLLLLVILAGMNLVGIRTTLVYAILGGLIWLAFLRSGVHPTIAGVLVAFTIPARHWIDAPTFLRRARDLLAQFEYGRHEPTQMLTDEVQQSAVIELEEACEQVQAPLQKLEHQLHGWVSLFVMPIFALANAGVAISFQSVGGETLPTVLGIVLGLTLGKPIGLIGAAWLATRAKIAALPPGVAWKHMIGAGVLGGIGFTMSLFIASLGLGSPALLEAAKIAILLGSLIAGSLGVLVLWRLGAADRAAEAASP